MLVPLKKVRQWLFRDFVYIPEEYKERIAAKLLDENSRRLRYLTTSMLMLGVILSLIDFLFFSSVEHPEIIFTRVVNSSLALISGAMLLFLTFTKLNDRGRCVAVYVGAVVLTSWSAIHGAYFFDVPRGVIHLMMSAFIVSMIFFFRVRLFAVVYGVFTVLFFVCAPLFHSNFLAIFARDYASSSVVLFSFVISRIMFHNRLDQFLRVMQYKDMNEQLGEEVTKRKVIQEQLEVAQEKLKHKLVIEERAADFANEQLEIFQRFADVSGQGFGMADLDGRIVYANQSLVRLLRYPDVESMIGQTVIEHMDEDIQQRLFQSVRSALLKGEQWIGELDAIGYDGKRTPTLTNFFMIPDENGEPHYLGAVVSDMRTHQQAEQSLRNSEVRYRTLFEAANDAIFLMDRERFVDCNPRTLEMFRCLRSEIVGKHPSEFSPELQWDKRYSTDAAKNYIGKAFEGESQFFEWLHKRKDGEVFFAEVSLNKIELSNVEYLIAIVRDISDRKDSERMYQESVDRLNQARKLDAVGRLAGGVAHDFNNLLTAISGNTDLALMLGVDDDRIRHFLEEIRKTTHRAADLTRQLLAFGRKQNSKPERVHVRSILMELEKMLGKLVGENVVLVINVSNDLWDIHIDPVQFEQILVNLVINAKDAIEDSGEIVIEARNFIKETEDDLVPAVVAGDYCRISIHDTGSGMSKEVQERAFDPFFTTKSKGKGTGLGLATVYGIIQQTSGCIDLRSEEGVGTEFVLYIPRSMAEKKSGNGNTVVKWEELKGDESILVVEDEESIRDLTTDILGKFGYSVYTADDGMAALEMCELRTKPYDLTISDVIMPKMNGLEFAGKLKNKWPDARVVFMSGYTEDLLERYGVEEGKMSLLKKPFNPQELLQLVRGELDKRSVAE